jgi:hypothetical protein
LTTFKKGDRVTATQPMNLPYWEDMIYVERGYGDIHICTRAKDGARGGFVLNGIKHLVADPLDTSKTLQTVDGKRVSYLGKLEDGRIVVQVTYTGGFGPGTIATELRYADGRKSNRPGVTSGDDVIVKVVEKVVYRNVYADGTTGSTQHASADDAKMRSKYGKVRIGVLKTTYRDGVRFSAILTATTLPWYRDSKVPSGRAATAEDFAR